MTPPDLLGWIHRTAKESPDGACRDWPWATNDKGYPSIKLFGRQMKASHVMLGATGRPRSDGAWALHSCDRPGCLAPWHLRWGTPAENVRDKTERDRAWRPKGEINTQSKLTDEAVREIRASTERYRILAERYGVHIKTIARVRQRKIWTHVEDAA